ncbi:hypothetical protein JCM10450v2_007091 [Rhodotorula kratochvilovae]
MSALDKALLREDCAAPVSLASLGALSPAQLAIASIRPDLDRLTRQRAYDEFLEKRKHHPGASDQPSLLDAPLDFAVPASLYSLSAAQLLLLQFNPRCISADEAHAAAALFLQLAGEAARKGEAAGEKPSERHEELSVPRCELQWDGGGREEMGGLSLRVEQGALAVVREGKALFRIEATDIQDFRYLAGADDGRDAMECTLAVKAATVALNPIVSVCDATAMIALGMLDAKDGRFVQLRTAVSRWSEAHGFAMAVVPPAPASTRAPSTDTHGAPRTDGSAPVSDLATRTASTSGLTSEERRAASDNERRRSRGRSSTPVDPSDPWQFVSSTPAGSWWHPGFYARQLAFLRAVVPHEDLPLLDFSLEGIALLSFAPAHERLPPLPPQVPPRERVNYSIRHESTERLALEHIYNERGRISLDATRLALLHRSPPPAHAALRSYARALARVVTARDVLPGAYARVLDRRLRTRLSDRSTCDPIEALRALVVRLRDDETFRKRFFTDAATGALIAHSPRGPDELGVGPHRRFEAALERIVRLEARAEEFARGRRGAWEEEERRRAGAG